MLSGRLSGTFRARSRTEAEDPANHLLINGRFLTRPATGVDRTATELIRALQRRRKSGISANLELSVAIPADAPQNDEIRARLELDDSSAIIRSQHRGYYWEQVDLALIRRDELLLSLCNVGPVLRRRQLVLMHDAQVYDVPESYSRSFRMVYRFLQPQLARRADVIATVSNYSCDRLQRNAVGRGRHFELLPNGIDHFDQIPVDPSVLERLNLRRGRYLLAIGSKAPHKNIPMLIEACSTLCDCRLPLVLVGAGDSGIFATSSLSYRDGRPGVIWTGRLDDGELKALYENARLFLLPSLTEGFGLPSLEAMACGCAVLASNAGALPETCGEAAAYCDPRDVQAWIASIKQLMATPRKLNAMRAAGRAQALRFRWDVSAARLLRIIDEAKAVKRRADPAPILLDDYVKPDTAGYATARRSLVSHSPIALRDISQSAIGEWQ